MAILVLIGALASAAVAHRGSWVERLAYTLVFALTLTPFAVTYFAFAFDRFITRGLVLTVALAVLAFVAILYWKRRPAEPIGKPEPAEIVTILLAGAVAAGAWLHYSNSEFLVSLSSYLQRGEAECYYMQTFRFSPELNPTLSGPGRDLTYGIINTPGNTLLTAPLLAFLGTQTFHVLYVGFQVLVFLFVYLILKRWTERNAAAWVAAVFAVANPYMGFIEVLDRNVVAMAFTAIVLYTVLQHPQRYIINGFLLGLCTGTGLRFMPGTIAIPVILLLHAAKTPARGYVLLFATAALTFAFNIPHLFHHGLHSLGQTSALPGLSFSAILGGERTPFLPYPTGQFYAAWLLRFWGYRRSRSRASAPPSCCAARVSGSWCCCSSSRRSSPFSLFNAIGFMRTRRAFS
ncbi:MAG: hypothetical protein M5R36_00225 [Deltaproteobacteria bacterium]|nr:hypothetical protein [Deltaproteobacteria bacterium]